MASGADRYIFSALPRRLFPGDPTAPLPVGTCLQHQFNEEFEACLAAEHLAAQGKGAGE